MSLQRVERTDKANQWDSSIIFSRLKSTYSCLLILCLSPKFSRI